MAFVYCNILLLQLYVAFHSGKVVKLDVEAQSKTEQLLKFTAGNAFGRGFFLFFFFSIVDFKNSIQAVVCRGPLMVCCF
jgi:hypothetical protein